MPQVDIERLEPKIVEQHQARTEVPPEPEEKKEIYSFDPKEGFEDITMKGNTLSINLHLHLCAMLILIKTYIRIYINTNYGQLRSIIWLNIVKNSFFFKI